MVKYGEASLSSPGRAREGVILGVDKAAWKPVSGAASAVAVAVVTEAPSAGVLVEAVVRSRIAGGPEATERPITSRVRSSESRPSFSFQHSMLNQLASTVPCFHPDAMSAYERFLVSSMNSPWNGPWYTSSHSSHL